MKRTLITLALSACALTLQISCSDGDSDPNGLGGASGYQCSDLGQSLGGQGGSAGSNGPSCTMPDAPSEKIEIAGSYTDGYASHEITTKKWVMGDTPFFLSFVDNDDNYAIARNAESATFNPCAWSRFSWTQKDDRLYYCQAPYDAETECEAISRIRPDSSDLDKGCDGFPWSTLTDH